MARLQPVRGTHDLLPEDARRHRHVTETARRVAATYGFEEMATPVLEFTEVFARTLGEATDVVTKEMYSFDDRSGDSLTLRPEGTAGVARALISNGLTQQVPAKFFYQGPMFRHERPQKGRQRQFHQIGVELIGVADPVADVEVIASGRRILDAIGLTGTVTLELNTLGDLDSRTAYREALVAYLERHEDALSLDSRERLRRNPLRILDSKDQGDRAVVADAPVFDAYLTPAAAAFFDTVTGHLDRLGIAYRRNPRLVRGLDYYCHTAFEFVSDGLGAQATVMAGGRYDGLVEMLGGPATPGVGWAAGIERLSLLLAAAPCAVRPVAVIPVGDDMTAAAIDLAEHLRAHGIPADLGYSGNLGRRLKRADRIGARAALLIGADEVAQDVVTLRDLDSGTQEAVARDAVAVRCAALLDAPGR